MTLAGLSQHGLRDGAEAMGVDTRQPSLSVGSNKLISHNYFSRSFCKSQSPQECIDLYYLLVIAKDKLTDLGGGRLLLNDFQNTFCEMTAPGVNIETCKRYKTSSLRASGPQETDSYYRSF